MSSAIEHLASLTVHRDRDLLDVTLAHAMRDLYRPDHVAIYMLVGPAGTKQRWLLRARLARGDEQATADPTWVSLDELPERDSLPEHAACIERQEIVVREDTQGGHLLLMPMLTQGDRQMVLELQCPVPFTGAERETADHILRVYRNFCGLLDYSERDTLTGLLNRKTFDDAFYKMTQGASGPTLTLDSPTGRRHANAMPRSQTGHWLGVLDIDHFKQVNDRYGHLIGDEVLLLVGRLLRTTFRFQDRLYRFGGEEFLVVLRCSTEAGARRALERLRSTMEAFAFPQVGRVTVSIGFTEVLPQDSPTAAFERADKAVYHAKQNGRNQVCSHGALVAAGALESVRQESEVELF